MTTHEAATALGVTGAAIRKALRLGRLRGSRDANGNWCIRPEAIENYRRVHQQGEERTCYGCKARFRWHYPFAEWEHWCKRCRRILTDRLHAGMTDAGYYSRTCAHCGDRFKTRHGKGRYCSSACRVEAWKARSPENMARWRQQVRDAAKRAYWRKKAERQAVAS